MSDKRTERLVALISVNQDDLYRYVYSLLPHTEDAKDVLQEALLAITGKFDEYDPSRPFLPWACKFAYYKVMQHRDQNQRQVRLFSTEVLELLAIERAEHAHVLQSRLAALEQCLDKLRPGDRELLRHRYHAKLSIDDIAARVGQSRRTLLRNLQRLRHSLFDCVGSNALLGDF